VETVDRRLARRQDDVAVLDDLVGRQAAVGAPEVHRSAARVEAHAEPARRLDLDLEQVARARGEDVVVVGRRRAARARQRGEPGAGRRPLDVGVDVRPDRIELDQPLEQRRLLGQAARGPLVEVVVAVDEPGRRQAAAGVDALDGAVVRGRGPLADRHDAVALDDEVAVAMLGSGGVDRGNRAALDDGPHASLTAASRTASRIFS
jgi:hypothetical protein